MARDEALKMNIPELEGKSILKAEKIYAESRAQRSDLNDMVEEWMTLYKADPDRAFRLLLSSYILRGERID